MGKPDRRRVVHHLGRHVLVRPADTRPLLAAFEPARAPEVAQLDVEPGVQQQIFWLDVAVQNVLTVQELHRPGGLIQKPNRQVLPQPRVAVDVQKQAPVARLFHHDVAAVAVLEGGHVADDERVGRQRGVDFSLAF